ncbi:putative eukaryotic membrane protein family [Diplodia seriata]|nr:putative eukaryotic membrane protein family [Diplodia seriata]
MRFDASKTYHNIRGQAAIKLYVIYNVLEVCDRLFSALGQDILECLLSRETLDRNADGRSKVIRPFWMFLLALAYTSIHSTALFYQVITLNVAVNSYSNALLTLLMSNQFVEIKGTVFKKFEKENLFQLTCADMVERFQLWLMLMIIACRNIVEVGGLSILGDISGSSSAGLGGNGTTAPFRSTSIIPKSFTIFPKWTGQVLGPFLLVLGSEMLVDWLKHAYITKFNNTKPAIYGRFLDVLAKDYYSNAFFDQNLTKRLGLPVLPLACLFIRATIQTYHMFLATHMPLPIASPATSLSVDSGGQATSSSSPATTAALAHIDHIFRRALGRSSFGAGGNTASVPSSYSWQLWSLDDVIAFTTMIVVFLVAYFVLLACKLVLGMVLLGFARARYKGMKEREKMVTTTDGRRVGGWGVVEVEDDKKRWIYADDPDGLRALRDREAKAREKEGKEARGADGKLEGTSRYSMVAKRIW